jgi:phage/plasmid primase-like uncharacterized protein
MKGQNMDLTKYFPQGNNLEQTKPKDTSDLINEMQSQGLQISYLEITGEIVRVPVNELAGVKADSNNQKSGYYVVNEVNGNYFATFGNWKTGFEGKWSSINHQAMTPQQREDLQRQLQEAKERSEETKKQRHNEVAKKVERWFDSYTNVIEHEYLTNKKVKNYGLKQYQDMLVCGVYSTTGDIRSLQFISKNGEKRFAADSEIKGNIFLIGAEIKDIPKLDKIILAEGYSTSATIYEATQIPVACVFSANFVMAVALQIRRLSGARIVIALDNDESGVGEKKAQECVQAVNNSCLRLPSEIGDFNDLYLKHGLDKVKSEIMEHKLGIQKYAVRNLVGKPEPQKFLVEGLVPIGKPGLLAASGGVGKSLSVIQLALRIACGNGRWWGKDVNEHGNVVVFAAEDDLPEIHRRLHLLDPKGERFKSEYDVYVFPIPEQKEPMILLTEEGVTIKANELVDELQAIPNLKLCVFDPLQAFTTGNVSSSNEVGQLWGSYCANISARLGCTTLTIHHLNKQGLTVDSDDSMVQRTSVRGASSLVDSIRFVLVMALGDVETCERICEEQRVPYDRMSVVKASLVKSNSGNVDYSTKTLFRRDGILEPLEELQNPMNLYDQF